MSSFYALPYVYAGTVGAAASALPLVATLLTFIRFYVRRGSRHPIGLDDWFTAIAALCFWGMSSATLYGISHHVIGYPSPPPPDPSNYDQVTDSLEGQTTLQQIQYGYWVLVVLTFGFIKLSVLFFYRRVFVVQQKSLVSIIIWTAIAVSALWTLILFLMQILICGSQPWQYWNTFFSGAKCVDGLQYLTSVAASDLATDVLIFLFPIPLVWNLQLPLAKKLSIIFLLLLGSLSVIASAFRLYITVAGAKAGYSAYVDVFLSITLVIFWTQLEAGIALIAINLPNLVRLFGL